MNFFFQKRMIPEIDSSIPVKVKFDNKKSKTFLSLGENILIKLLITAFLKYTTKFCVLDAASPCIKKGR